MIERTYFCHIVPSCDYDAYRCTAKFPRRVMLYASKQTPIFVYVLYLDRVLTAH